MGRQRFIDAVSELDGRSDQRISAYYVETGPLSRVKRSNSPAIAMVGLKGSGKSTLYRLLTEHWASEPAVLSRGLSPDRSEFERHGQRLNCLQFAGAVRQSLPILLVELIDQELATSRAASTDEAKRWRETKAALFASGSAMHELQQAYQGLSILAAPLEDLAKGRGDFSVVPQAEMEALSTLLASFSELKLRFRVVVDDPDRLFTSGGEFDPHLLAGYILGTNYISKNLKYLSFVHIIKGNVLGRLNSIEEMANLPIDYFDFISWTNSELESVIRGRLRYAGVEDSEIFSDPLEELIKAFSEEIRNGPRDLLRYLEIILKSTPDSMVGMKTIQSHRRTFRRSARHQVEAVYGDLYGGMESVLQSLFDSVDDLSCSDLARRFRENRLASIPEGVDYSSRWLRTAEDATRGLIEAGAVDLLTEDGWRKPFEEGYFLQDIAPAVRLRPTAIFRPAG